MRHFLKKFHPIVLVFLAVLLVVFLFAGAFVIFMVTTIHSDQAPGLSYMKKHTTRIEESFNYRVKVTGGSFTGAFYYEITLNPKDKSIPSEQCFYDACKIIALIYENTEKDPTIVKSPIANATNTPYHIRVVFPQLDDFSFSFEHEYRESDTQLNTFRTNVFFDYSPMETLGIENLRLIVDGTDFSQEEIDEIKERYKDESFVYSFKFPTETYTNNPFAN